MSTGVGLVDTPVKSRDSAVTHADLEEGRKIMAQHFDTRFDGLEKIIKSGFPNGDPIEHRKVHEGYIKDAAERSALWRSVREKTLTGVIWGFLILIGGIVWEWFKAEVKR